MKPSSKQPFSNTAAGNIFSALVALMLVAALLWSDSTSAEMVFVPGTSVSLDAPAGFELASGFSGLKNELDGSSITISELPAKAYDEVLELFEESRAGEDSFAQQEVFIDHVQTIQAAGQDVPFLIGTQAYGGSQIAKYMALLRGERTVLLTFSIFETDAMTAARVQEVVESVQLSTAVSLGQKLQQLPFSFQVEFPFRIGDTLGGSSVILPSFDGVDASGDEPMLFIVSAQNVKSLTQNLALEAERLLRKTSGFEAAEIVLAGATEFADGPAHYSHATSEGRSILQYIRKTDAGLCIRLIAIGETEKLNKLIPSIAKVAQSVTLR